MGLKEVTKRPLPSPSKRLNCEQNQHGCHLLVTFESSRRQREKSLFFIRAIIRPTSKNHKLAVKIDSVNI